MRYLSLSTVFVAAVLILSLAPAVAEAQDDRIQPSEGNPRYWQYEGEPVVLIGGSKQDNLFQIPDLEEHLDLMEKVGANYVRNTMSSRDSGNVRAFERLQNGKYDLDRWNEEYWDRFERMLELTAEREIFVQIELWDQWDYNRGRWDEHPWNPDQNVNYSTANTELKGDGHYAEVDAVLGQPGRPDRPAAEIEGGGTMDFFQTVPALQNDRRVLRYQKRFVDRILSYSLEHDHVLYTITNELFMQHSAEWSRYWARYLREQAAEAGEEIEVTEMFHNHSIRHEQHRACFDHPELFSFIDISQNSLQDPEVQWANLQWLRAYVSHHPRPISHVKTYGGGTSGGDRLWRTLIGGGASVRFHRPTSGIGLSGRAQAHLKSARMLTEEVELTGARPDANYDRLSERSANEAFHTRTPEGASVVYFPDGGAVELKVASKGPYQVRWLDVRQSRWRPSRSVSGEGNVHLDTPGTGDWVGVVRDR